MDRKILPAIQFEVKERTFFAIADSMAVLGRRARISRRTGEKKGNSRGVPLLTSKHRNWIAVQRLLGEFKWRKAVFVVNFVEQLDNFWTAARYFNKLYYIILESKSA